MTHVVGTLNQTNFRERNDDGSETAATWKAAENVSTSAYIGETFRLRFTVQEIVGGAANSDYLLFYRINGGAWAETLGTTPVRIAPSLYVTDGEATTKQLNGTGVFTPGVVKTLEGSTGNINLGANENTEVEWNLLLQQGEILADDLIEFQLRLGNGNLLDTYEATPSILAMMGVVVYDDSVALHSDQSVSSSNILNALVHSLLTMSKVTSSNSLLDTLTYLNLNKGLVFLSAADIITFGKKVYINNAAEDVGREEHNFISWSNTQVELSPIDTKGLSGTEYYFKVLSVDGIESNWYGPISISQAVIEASVTLSKVLNIAETSKIVTSAILTFNKLLSVEDIGFIIHNMYIELQKTFSTSYARAVLAHTLANLAIHSNILNIVKKSTLSELLLDTSSILDIVKRLVSSKILDIEKYSSVESVSSIVALVNTTVNNNYELFTFKELLASVSLQIYKEQGLETTSNLIAHAIVSLDQHNSTYLVTQTLGVITEQLILNKVINVQDVSVLVANVLTSLNSSHSVDSLTYIVANVAAQISKILSVEDAASFITHTLINLDIDITESLFEQVLSDFVEVLSLTNNYSVDTLSSIIAAAHLVLLNNTNVQNIASKITRSLAGIGLDIDFNDIERHILIQLLYSENLHKTTIYNKISVITRFIRLTNSLDIDIFEKALKLIFEYITLDTTLSISDIVQLIYNVSISLNKEVSPDITEASDTVLRVGLNIHKTVLFDRFTDYVISFVINNLLNTEAASNRISTSTTELDTNIFNSLDVNRALLGSISTQLQVIDSGTSSRTFTKLISLLASAETTTGNSNNIFKVGATVDSLLNAEIEKTLDTISILDIGFSKESLAYFLSDTVSQLSLHSSYTNVNLAKLNTFGVLTLSKNIVEDLRKKGILNVELEVLKQTSLELAKALIANAGIDIQNAFVINTTFGFDIGIGTPDGRVYIIKFDNRELTVQSEDREVIVYKDNRLQKNA